MGVLEVNRPEIRDLNIFIAFAKRMKGLDLSSYRQSFLLRRLKVRMDIHKLYNLLGYVKILEDEPKEWENFLESLSINVSEFFRDPDVFNFFYNNCIKNLIEKKKLNAQKTIRLWSAGCSFGEEAYSLAILLKEALPKDSEKLIRIWATDIEKSALSIARKGEYLAHPLKNIEDKLLKKYFMSPSEGRWIIKEDIKKLVSFKQHDLLSDPPLRFMDVVFCRNVRIYFNMSQGEKVLFNIHSSLREGGYLVIGKVETLPTPLKNLFLPIEGYYKIFQKLDLKGR